MRRVQPQGGLLVLRVVAMLAWFTYGPKGKSVASGNHIPAKIGEGGKHYR
jgi:hypothetical protein